MNNIDKPNLEALKELARYAVLFVVSWIITETLNQVNVIPESLNLQVWLFTYAVPARLLLTLGLTMVGRYIDKYLFTKTHDNPNVETKGLLPF